MSCASHSGIYGCIHLRLDVGVTPYTAYKCTNLSTPVIQQLVFALLQSTVLSASAIWHIDPSYFLDFSGIVLLALSQGVIHIGLRVDVRLFLNSVQYIDPFLLGWLEQCDR